MKTHLVLICDGGSQNNGGECGIGVVGKDFNEGITLFTISDAVGTGTNNFAEYKAVIAGLREACARINDISKVTVLSDSNLIISQLNGTFEVKTPALLPLYTEAIGLIKNITGYGFEVVLDQVPTEYTFEAHNLGQEAIKGAVAKSVSEKYPFLSSGPKN